MRHSGGDSWIGLLVFAGAILFQLYAALRKGKAAKPPEPRTPGTTRSGAPAPIYRPVPSAPAPWRPEPVAVPPRSREEPVAASLPPKLREIFDELSSPTNGEPVAVAAAPVPDAASMATARRLEAAEGSASAPPPATWSRLRARGRDEWQRAFVLSEILQPPIALRPDVLSRSAHI